MSLIEQGLILIEALDKKASEYHIKSDVSEALSWELVGIRTRVNDLKEGNHESRKDQKYRDIEWDSRLGEYYPELASLVRNFYKRYYGE